MPKPNNTEKGNSVVQSFFGWFRERPYAYINGVADILKTSNLSVWLFREGRIWNINLGNAFLGAFLSGFVVFSVMLGLIREIIPSLLATVTIESTKIFGNSGYRYLQQNKGATIPTTTVILFYVLRLTVIVLSVACCFIYLASSLNSPHLKDLMLTAQAEAKTDYENLRVNRTALYASDEKAIRDDFTNRIERLYNSNRFAERLQEMQTQLSQTRPTSTRYNTLRVEIKRLEDEAKIIEDSLIAKRDTAINALKPQYIADLKAYEDTYLTKIDDATLKVKFKDSDAAQHPTVLSVKETLANLGLEVRPAWFTVAICLLSAILIELCIWFSIEAVTIANQEATHQTHESEQKKEVLKAQADAEITHIETETEVQIAEIHQQFAVAGEPAKQSIKQLTNGKH